MSLFDDVKITKAEAAVLEGTRPREIGRNSHSGPIGQEARDPIVRIHSDAGIVGWAWSPATVEDGRRLVGKRLADQSRPFGHSGTSPGEQLSNCRTER